MMIKTVKAFIEAIGGNASAAKAFSVSKPAVSNWTTSGRFPGWATMRVMQIAQTNGLALDPKLFTRVRKPKQPPAIHAAE
jgi:hypothetical protein